MCELKDLLEEEMNGLRINKDPKVLAYALLTARVTTVLNDRKVKC